MLRKTWISTSKSFTQLKLITSLFLWNSLYEFLGTNYCVPERWSMGPLQLSLPSLAQTFYYATAWWSCATPILQSATVWLTIFVLLCLWSRLYRPRVCNKLLLLLFTSRLRKTSRFDSSDKIMDWADLTDSTKINGQIIWFIRAFLWLKSGKDINATRGKRTASGSGDSRMKKLGGPMRGQGKE